MDEIPWVSSYKYLGCVIDEFLDCSEMVEHGVKLGSQALGAWLRRCCESVGEVNGRSFLQLLQSLVESVLLYGVEIWGCHHKLEGLSHYEDVVVCASGVIAKHTYILGLLPAAGCSTTLDGRESLYLEILCSNHVDKWL